MQTGIIENANPLSESGDGPFRFDRRASQRWESASEATAFVLDSDAFGRIIELRLVDCAHEGIGAISPDALVPGTTISLGFSDRGMTARRGVVTRCTPCGEGYRLGVRFEHRMAA